MERLIVGVSGGPDSLMLLDKLVKENKTVVVAHVNYQHRPTAFRDEELVVAYCQKNNIPLERLYPAPGKGNFQAWAREIRYSFFAQLVAKYNYDGVAVAHQLNDLVETYLLQKQRGGVVEFYGLAMETKLFGVTVYRPLLDYDRQEILAYCEENKINYGLDETNEFSLYQRNIIRREVAGYSQEKLKTILAEINQANWELTKQKVKTSQDLESLLNRELKTKGYHYLSAANRKELLRQLLAKGYSYQRDKFLVERKEGKVVVSEISNLQYSITLEKPIYRKFEYFEISKSGSETNRLKLSPDDWPLTIRNWQKGDRIELTQGSKKISTYFKGKNLSISEKMSWPVILNKAGEIIMVPDLIVKERDFVQQDLIYVIKLYES